MDYFSTTMGADVIIVIPSLNEQDHIADVVRRIQSDASCSQALIVLADGGSRDRTVPIVEDIARLDDRVIVMKTDVPLSISASINAAVERFGVGRRWLVRIDAHAEYSVDYGSQLVRTAMLTGATAVVTPMSSRGHSCFQRAAAAAQNSYLGTGGSAHRLVGGASGWVEHGHHALIALETFMSVGGYDETFSHNEDAELDHRILDAGGRIWLAAELPLVYYPRGTARSLARQYFKYGQGRAMTVRRHSARRRVRQVLPLVIAPVCCLSVLSPFDWLAAVPALLWVVTCLTYGLILGLRKETCTIAAGLAAVIMHGAWSFGYWTFLIAGRHPGAPPARLVSQTSSIVAPS